MKFSIIVPCYNTKDYLNDCVNSILAQNFSDYELLLVDDGSKDETQILCDEWQEKEGHIRTFHKENGGLSDARNYGIEHAQGDYLVFIDSDDFIAPKSLESIAKCTGNNPDVIITRLIEYFNAEKFYIKDEKISEQLTEEPSKEEAITWLMKESQNTWPAQKYIVSNKMIIRENMHFKKGILHEDIDWTTRLVLTAKKFSSCEYPWYFHRMQRDGSIMNTVRAKNITDILETADDLINSEDSPLYSLENGELQKTVINRIISSVFGAVNFFNKLDKDEKKVIEAAVCEHRDLLELATKKRHKLFVEVMNLFGVSAAFKILEISATLKI